MINCVWIRINLRNIGLQVCRTRDKVQRGVLWDFTQTILEKTFNVTVKV